MSKSFSNTCRDNLLLLARTYARAKKKTLGAVSKEIYGNVKFFPGLQSGEQSVSIAKVDEMLETFEEKWPEGLPWPYLDAMFFHRPQKNG